MATELLKEYDTTLDTKHRITVRGQKKLFKNYHVCIYKDGKIMMEPRVLIHPKYISQKTLRMMDRAMENFSKGVRSEPIDTDEMRKIADALPD